MFEAEEDGDTSCDEKDDDIQWQSISEESDALHANPDRTPIPDFTCLVDRALRENRSYEVWDLVSGCSNKSATIKFKEKLFPTKYTPL